MIAKHRYKTGLLPLQNRGSCVTKKGCFRYKTRFIVKNSNFSGFWGKAGALHGVEDGAVIARYDYPLPVTFWHSGRGSITIFLAEGHYDINLLEAELLHLYDNEADKQAVSLFLNWFRQLAVHGKVAPADYAKLDYVYRTKEEVQTMLVATLAEERKKIYETGFVEGKAEGQEKALLTVVESRFQLTPAEHRQVTEQIGKITDGQILTFLLKRCVQAATLAEFMTTLTEALPKEPTAKEA